MGKLVGGIAILLGSLLFVAMTGSAGWLLWQARDWETTTGEVIAADEAALAATAGPELGGLTLRFAAADGTTHESRSTLAGTFAPTPGDQVEVWYNPDDPSHALPVVGALVTRLVAAVLGLFAIVVGFVAGRGVR